MNLVLKQLNLKANQKAKKLKLPSSKPKKREWWQILLGSLLGIFSIAVEFVATALLGPVGGMIVGTIADVSTNVIGDVIQGENPFEINNLIFNVVLPVASIPTKAFTISKIDKNKVYKIGQFAEDDKLSKLAKRLNSIDVVDDLDESDRVYKKILRDLEIDSNDLKYHFDSESLVTWKDSIKKNQFDKLSDINKMLRIQQRILSYFDDPNFAPKAIVKFIIKETKLSKYFDEVNKGLLKFKKTIKTKFFKNANKKLRKVIIEFNNHTVAPWIYGIRLYPIKGAINWYHVSVFFNKELTNNKPPVNLYNKSWKLIYAWLTAPSCGQYYINRISWGWEVGKLIRNNGLILNNFNVYFIKSQRYQTYYLTAQLITKTASFINKAINGQLVSDFYEAYTPDNFAQNIIYGAADNLKVGGTFIKKMVRAAQTGDIRYINKYVKHIVKKNVEKKVKEEIIDWKNQKGYIGYGKYKYRIYKK